MAKKELETVQTNQSDLMDFYAFKDNGKYKDDIVVGVNGKIWRIKRGEHVKIPLYVARVIENSLEQDEKTARLIEKTSDQ